MRTARVLPVITAIFFVVVVDVAIVGVRVDAFGFQFGQMRESSWEKH